MIDTGKVFFNLSMFVARAIWSSAPKYFLSYFSCMPAATFFWSKPTQFYSCSTCYIQEEPLVWTLFLPLLWFLQILQYHAVHSIVKMGSLLLTLISWKLKILVSEIGVKGMFRRFCQVPLDPSTFYSCIIFVLDEWSEMCIYLELVHRKFCITRVCIYEWIWNF